MQKVKCPYCDKTLFFASLADLEIKCPKCKKIIEIKIKEQTNAK